MKMRLLALLSLFVVGCASSGKKAESSASDLSASSTMTVAEPAVPEVTSTTSIETKVKAQKKSIPETYIGLQGYLNRPPIFTDKKYEKSFQRCSPAEITGVYQSGGQILVYVKQNGYTYPLMGLNRKAFSINSKKRLQLLDKFFVKDLKWAKSDRQVATIDDQKICSGQTWQQMPKKQFRFLNGDPESTQPLKSQQGQYEVWTYGDGKQSSMRKYYFLSGKLYTWTQ